MSDVRAAIASWQRLISAGLLLPLIVGMVYWGVWPLAILTAVSIVVALLELYRVLEQHGYCPRYSMGLLSALLLFGAACFQGVWAIDWTGLALGSSLLLVLIGELPRRDHQHSLVNWTLSFALACYTGWLLSHYILLRKLQIPLDDGLLAFLRVSSGAAWVYLVLAITWVEDTAAYLVGRRWGKHQMAPYLSPKKSWEGAAGGFVAAILTALVAVPLLGLPISYGGAVLLGATGGVVGQLGDLVESLIKRQIGVKDISNLIPGHGGIFDRIDSMIFTAPVLYYLILLLTTSV